MSRHRLSVLFTLILSWGLVIGLSVAGVTPELGLDLAGGTAVILQAEGDSDSEVLDRAVEVMRRRIEDIGGVQEPVIQVLGDQRVEVQLPGVTDEERAIEAVGSTGQLSFRPVVGLVGIIDADGTTTFFAEDDPQVPNELTQRDDPTTEAVLIDDDGVSLLWVGPAFAFGSDVGGSQVLPPGLHGGPGWAVSLDFTSGGASKFEAATTELATYPVGDDRRRLAIVLDGEVVSSPPLAPDFDPVAARDSAVITLGGEAGEQEARDLSVILRYGALPVTFQVDLVQSVSATLGRDTLRAGIAAGIGGLILVALALLFYYRALGAVAVVGLTIFGSLLVSAYALLGELFGLTLTLAGVAGIIVSVGITSDSYIVYFERIKEELHQDMSITTAVEDGFRRAFRTILTADTVSFTGAALLWWLAIGPVKGFALALGLATLIDVFVAYFYTRPAAALLARSRLADRGSFSVMAAASRGTPAEAAA